MFDRRELLAGVAALSLSPAVAAKDIAVAKKILMVVTNHGDIDGKPATGIWFTEFSEPFEAFRRAGAEVTVASPKGGPAPVDPRGYPDKDQIASVRDALATLNATAHLSSIDPALYDGVFVPGGHGPMFDLAVDPEVKRCIATFWEARKPISAVCHGPAALLDVRLSSGATLLNGRRVTGFTKGEDAADDLFRYMPFSLQERMSAEGAHFVEHPPWSVHVETRLVTGQNPASAEATAKALLAVLESA